MALSDVEEEVIGERLDNIESVIRDIREMVERALVEAGLEPSEEE